MTYDPEKDSIAKHTVTVDYDLEDGKFYVWTTQPIEKSNEQFGGHFFSVSYNDIIDLTYLIQEAVATADAVRRLNRNPKQ